MKFAALAVLLPFAANAQVVRSIPPVNTPLRAVIVVNDRGLGPKLLPLVPAGVVPTLRTAVKDMLPLGPVLVMAVPGKYEAAVFSRVEERRAELVYWGKQMPRSSRWLADSARWSIENAAEKMGGLKASRDATATAAVFAKYFDGRALRDDSVTYHGDIKTRGAVAFDTQEVRAKAPRSELRSWNKATGKMFLAAIPRQYHHYLLDRNPGADGRVGLTLWNDSESVERRATYDPLTGRLWIDPKNRSKRPRERARVTVSYHDGY